MTQNVSKKILQDLQDIIEKLKNLEEKENHKTLFLKFETIVENLWEIEKNKEGLSKNIIMMLRSALRDIGWDLIKKSKGLNPKQLEAISKVLDILTNEKIGKNDKDKCGDILINAGLQTLIPV